MKIYHYDGKANIVGKQIRKLRKENHISQEALTARLQLNNIELSQKAISRIEKQERLSLQKPPDIRELLLYLPTTHMFSSVLQEIFNMITL